MSDSNPQQGATIEVKLKKRLRNYFGGPNITSPAEADLVKDIMAIITTENTKARINTLQELQPCDDHYDSKAVHLEDITAHIAALQEEQL